MYLLRKNKLIATTLIGFTYLVLCSFFVFADDNLTQQSNLSQDINFSDFNLNELNLTSNITADTNITINNTTTENLTIENQNQTNQTQANNTNLQNTTNTNQNKNKNNFSLQNDLKTAYQSNKDTTITFVSVSINNFDTLIRSDISPYDFVYYKDKLLLRINPIGEAIFYYLDVLGNVRGAFDENNSVLSSKDYLLFGEQINNFGQTSGKSFTKKEQDRSDLYFFGARYYNAITGRFISVDPLYGGVESPYVYAKDNPLKFFDPDGKKAQLIGAGLADNTRLQQLYINVGSIIPRVKNIISDTYDHIIANKDANVDYFVIYQRKENQAKLEGKEIDGVTVNLDLSLIDVNKIGSYGYGKDNILLHQLFHESVHQADIVAAQEKGIKYDVKTTSEIELNIENEIYDSLGLEKSYEEQIKDKDSWVVKNQVSKKEYKNIVRISNSYIEHYQALVEQEIKGEK